MGRLCAVVDKRRRRSSSRQIQGIGDFDRDGFADILWRDTQGRLTIWFKGSDVGAAFPTYRSEPGRTVDASWQIAGVSDFSGDGFADILWHHTSGRVAYWTMNGGQFVGDVYPESPEREWTLEGLRPTAPPKFDPDLAMGTRTVVVPDVRGDTRTVAKQTLNAVGLVVGGVSTVADRGAIGQIVSQEPTPGVHQPPGSAVHLTIGVKPKIICQ
jgi:hypothetical protein